MPLQFLPAESQASRDARLEFRYKKNWRNPLTGLPTVHTWSSSQQIYCQCGKFDRNNPKLAQLTHEELKTFSGVLCRRCTWSDPGAKRRLYET